MISQPRRFRLRGQLPVRVNRHRLAAGCKKGQVRDGIAVCACIRKACTQAKAEIAGRRQFLFAHPMHFRRRQGKAAVARSTACGQYGRHIQLFGHGLGEEIRSAGQQNDDVATLVMSLQAVDTRRVQGLAKVLPRPLAGQRSDALRGPPPPKSLVPCEHLQAIGWQVSQ